MDSESVINHSRVTVVEITDPGDGNAGIESIELDAVQLEARPFRARRVVVTLETTTLLLHSTNHRVRTRARALGDKLVYATFGPRTRGTANGLHVRPDLLLAVEPGAEVAYVTDANWETVTVMVDPGEIRAHLDARQRTREFRLPKGVELLRASPERVRHLFDIGKRLATTAERYPALLDDRESDRSAAEVELVEALLSALSVADELTLERADRTRQAYTQIVKTVEAHALARMPEHLGISELCKVAAVSERTLQNAFREVMGLAPLAYLTRLRLNRVRHALLTASPSATKVSVEAAKWGFWHFGEFSRAYKACFGEAPSETLRRPNARAQRGEVRQRADR